MTIGQLAMRTSVPASTIRYWERIGVLPPPPRVSGQRRYSQDAINRIALLKLAQACGFRLEEMRRLLHGFRPDVTASNRWKKLAAGKRAEIDLQIARLKAMQQVVERVLRCRCMNLDECGRLAARVMDRQALSGPLPVTEPVVY